MLNRIRDESIEKIYRREFVSGRVGCSFYSYEWNMMKYVQYMIDIINGFQHVSLEPKRRIVFAIRNNHHETGEKIANRTVFGNKASRFFYPFDSNASAWKCDR